MDSKNKSRERTYDDGEWTVGQDADGKMWIRHNAPGCGRKSYAPRDIKGNYCAKCGTSTVTKRSKEKSR